MTEWETKARALMERAAYYIAGGDGGGRLHGDISEFLAKPSGDVPQDVAGDAVEVCKRLVYGEPSAWSSSIAVARSVVERMKERHE